MKSIKVLFTPVEPYFFGNEKGFSFPGQKNGTQFSNQYFIKSEPMPLQTTILGALRYIFLPIKKSNFSYTSDEFAVNSKCIGEESFDVEKTEQSFGYLKNVSPVFLTNNNVDYVVTPFDHINGKKVYTPFSDYKKVQTPAGEKLYTEEFDAKEGVEYSFMSLKDGSIVPFNDIFDSVVRVGIDKVNKKDAFFKKQYSILCSGWSFAAYLEADDELNIPEKNVSVFLGQGKSTFAVSFSYEENNLENSIKALINDNTLYCMGDSFVNGDIYANSLFAVVKSREYRAYKTSYSGDGIKKGKISKESVLYRMVSAGSVFVSDHHDGVLASFENKNCRQIGFNTIISGGKNS